MRQGPNFESAFAAMPLIAILRGVKPEEVLEIGQQLIEAGFTIIEVPLNSPEPVKSIGLLAEHFGDAALIGAGTVLDTGAVNDIKQVRGRLVVSPHFDPEIVKTTKKEKLYAIPGVATPSEAFAAIRCGADALKLFPGEGLPPVAVKSMKAVLPPDIPLIPVGGITVDKMEAYLKAGAAGFGIGSDIYKAGRSAAEVHTRAAEFVQAMQSLKK